jgi:hypothetical protein
LAVTRKLPGLLGAVRSAAKAGSTPDTAINTRVKMVFQHGFRRKFNKEGWYPVIINEPFNTDRLLPSRNESMNRIETFERSRIKTFQVSRGTNPMVGSHEVRAARAIYHR